MVNARASSGYQVAQKPKRRVTFGFGTQKRVNVGYRWDGLGSLNICLIAVVIMQATGNMGIISKPKAKPAGHDFVERCELDEIVWKTAKNVVAPHGLQPVQLAILDAKH